LSEEKNWLGKEHHEKKAPYKKRTGGGKNLSYIRIPQWGLGLWAQEKGTITYREDKGGREE